MSFPGKLSRIGEAMRIDFAIDKSDMVCQKMEEIESLKKSLKECGKYAKIIKVGLEKNDARLLEAEQIERIANDL